MVFFIYIIITKIAIIYIQESSKDKAFFIINKHSNKSMFVPYITIGRVWYMHSDSKGVDSLYSLV